MALYIFISKKVRYIHVYIEYIKKKSFDTDSRIYLSKQAQHNMSINGKEVFPVIFLDLKINLM